MNEEKAAATETIDSFGDQATLSQNSQTHSVTYGRKIVLDTETTGLSAEKDRIFEIACIEIWDYEGDFNYGEEFHYYLNPQQRLSADSIRITGVLDDALCNKPTFDQIVDHLLDFLQDSPIVAHNVNFDMDMINAELVRCGRPKLKNPTIDTLVMARAVYPTGSNSLDSLCAKMKINTDRTLHGALKDAKDLSRLYFFLINMYGGLQTIGTATIEAQSEIEIRARANPSSLTQQEIEEHNHYLQQNNITF